MAKVNLLDHRLNILGIIFKIFLPEFDYYRDA